MSADAPIRLPRRKRILFACAAVGIGLFAALFLLEVSLRWFLVRQGEYIDYMRERASREWGGELVLFDIIKPSPNPARVYELYPGANGTYAGQPLKINSSGFRDPERSIAKPPGTRRIAVLGDSIAFGWGARMEDRFSNQLEKLLTETTSTAAPPAAWEVLNFAVPGYNTVMELATLRDAVLACSPDIIVLSMVNNDADLPNFVRIRPQGWSLSRCFIIETIRDRMIGRKLGDTARLARGGVAEAGGVGHGSTAQTWRPELVPPEYRFLMGDDNMHKALREMAEELRQRRIRAICLPHHAIVKPSANAAALVQRDGMTVLAQGAGFEICDPTDALTGYLTQKQLPESALWATQTDPHPNATAHLIIARELMRCVK